MKNKKQILAVLASILVTIFSIAVITKAVVTIDEDDILAFGTSTATTGTSTPDSTLHINQATSTLYVNETTGKVGIGTSTPVHKLEVMGDININTNGTNALFSTYKGANSNGYNIFIGGGGQSSAGSLGATFRGSYNTSNGYYALYANTIGNSNIANGYSALYFNTAGNSNIANGNYSLYSNTIGNSNIANGNYSLYSNATGSSNVASGNFSLYFNTTGSANTANGVSSLYYNKTGSNNVVMGYYAGSGSSKGSNISNSVLLGYEAGKTLLTAGSNNILIGYKAGDALTTGAKNIVIGYDIDTPAINSANTLNIGNFIYALGLDGSGAILSNGKMGIGTVAPTSILHVDKASASTVITVGGSGGTKGACLKLFDSDGGGWTYCTVKDGAMACSTASCE